MYTLPNKDFLPSFLPSFLRVTSGVSPVTNIAIVTNTCVRLRITTLYRHVSVTYTCQKLSGKKPCITEDTIDMIEERRTVTQLPQKSDEQRLRCTIAHNAVCPTEGTSRRQGINRSARKARFNPYKKIIFNFLFSAEIASITC